MEPTHYNTDHKSDMPAVDYSDPAGTSPNRYSNTMESHNSGYGYSQSPENHPAPEDRLLHPDKGEY